MATLSAFLHPEQTGNKEVVVSERFKENGEVVPFVIRPLTQEENAVLLKAYRKVDKGTGIEIFNRVGYNQAMVAAAVVEPDLNNAELQKAWGVLGPENVLTAMLYVGEYSRLMEEVQKLSGLDTDINDEIEEAKN